jgi:hypothetical protein
MKMVNLATGRIEETPPTIGGVDIPSRETLLAAGYRDIPVLCDVAAGYERSPASYVEGDGVTAQAVYQDRLTSEIEAEREAARLQSFAPLIPTAALFKALIRRNFGANAETNTEITADIVQGYFVRLTLTGEITAQQASDGVLLQQAFEKLAAWNGTGETWTLPWEVVP